MSLYPELQDLSTWMSSKQAVCEKLPDQVWRLFTPGDNGIFQAIMLSYLISSSHLEIREQARYRLTALLGENYLKTKSILNLENRVLLYNPFRNSKQPIFSKLEEKKFKENLNWHFENKGENCENSNISAILTAASSMLKCSIFLFKTNENHSKSLETYQAGTVTPSSKKLYLFYYTCKDLEPKLKNSFSYGIKKDEALHFRKAALKQILKLIKLDKSLDSFADEIFLGDNFLISILRCSNSHVLNKICEFPLLTTELIQSGFKINPLITDENGLSAFFYALLKADFSLLLWLYYYAVDNFDLSEETSRKPEVAILNVVERIQNSLDDKLISLNFSSFKKKGTAIHVHSQFMFFIKFQIDFIKKVIEIKESNLYDKENVYKKQIIIALIDTYKNYFYFNMRRNITIKDKFKNYIKCNDYYNIVDNFFSCVFFEHFLSLRCYLNDQNGRIYTDTVASLFLLIQSKIFFNKNKDSKVCTEGHFQCYVALHYRENFLLKAEKLKEELEKVGNEDIQELKAVKDIVKSLLIDHPEISNIIIAGRVKQYLTIVLNMKNSKTSKKMLVMERGLQVFGELIQNEGITNCPMKHYLCSCLEDGAESKIMLIRNTLSHYGNNCIQGQLYIENNVGIFKNLLTEIKGLSEILDRIHHLCEIQDIMILRAIDEAKLYFQDVVPYLEKHKAQFFKMQKETYLIDKVGFALLAKNMLNYLSRNMDKMKTSPLLNEKKIKAIKNIVEAFIHLLDFIINCSADNDMNVLKYDLESFRNIHSKTKVSDSFLQCEIAISPLLKKCLDTVSRLEVFKNNQDSLLFCSPLITKELGEKYQKYEIFNPKESNFIWREINTYLEKSKEAKLFCLEYIDSEDVKVLKKKLSIIVTTKERKRNIENFIDNNSRIRAKKCLEQIKDLTIDSIFKSKDHPTDAILSMSTEVQRFLFLQLKFKGKFKLRKKVLQLMNQKISFLINRINKLEEILIKPDKLILYLWRRRKNENIKTHVKSLICQRYLRKYETRAAAEMLIMDCMGIFGDKKGKDLWIKANDLFSGINLRDILAHGNPLVQRVSNILDPSDFVSALVDHIVDLLDDKSILNALSILWLMQKETNLSDFIETITGESNKGTENCSKRDLKVQQLRKQITNSDRWERYVELLPLSNKS